MEGNPRILDLNEWILNPIKNSQICYCSYQTICFFFNTKVNRIEGFKITRKNQKLACK